MTTKRLGAYLGFSHFLGIGPVRFNNLITYFKTPEDAYEASVEKISEVIGTQIAHEFVSFRHTFPSDSILKKLSIKHIQCITREDSQYPEKLLSISDAPICLYVKGDASILTSHPRYIAIVGTRKPTEYGTRYTALFAKELSRHGCAVISGMALGIDAVAHWATIKEKGRTIAVFGCGIDIIYPPSHRSLYEIIIRSGGALVSEFPPGRRVHPGLFVARNRIIAGLSDGVLVVEGTKTSGSLTTARYAAAQGRDVFALPSPISSPLSEAPHILIKQGAKLVTHPSEILEEYEVTYRNIDNSTTFALSI